MLRRVGLAISYFIAILYFLSILLPSLYCFQHGCKGGGDGDAFMPAFFFAPIGAIATAFSLQSFISCPSCCLLSIVSSMAARVEVTAMLLCLPSFLLRLAQSQPLSRCTMPYKTSEKDNAGPGFSGLWQLFSPSFSLV